MLVSRRALLGLNRRKFVAPLTRVTKESWLQQNRIVSHPARCFASPAIPKPPNGGAAAPNTDTQRPETPQSAHETEQTVSPTQLTPASSLKDAEPSSGTEEGTGGKPKEGGFSISRAIGAVLFPIMLYLYERWSAKSKAVACVEEDGIAATQREIKSLMERAKFSQKDLDRIVSYIKQYYQHGFLLPDEFGQIVSDVVSFHILERQRLFRQAAARSAAGEGDWGGGVDQIDFEFEEEEDPAEILKRQVKPWEPLCLSRLSPRNEQLEIDVRELLTGLALFAHQFKQQDFRLTEAEEAKLNEKQIERRNKDEFAKLRFVWSAAESVPEAGLTRGELTDLLDRLIRTGHIEASSLVTQTQFLPPKFEPVQPGDLADRYWQDLSSMAPSRQDTPAPERITRDQFERVTASMTVAKHFVPWYLPEVRFGFFKRTGQKLMEKGRRYAHEQGWLEDLIRLEAGAGFEQYAYALPDRTTVA